MTSKEKLLLFILACVNFTHIVDFMIMMPLGPQLMQIFHISPQEFGFAVSAYSLTAGISGFLAAFFVDRLDRKKVLLFAYIGFVIGTFACASSPNYYWLVSARILAGFFGGMIGSQVLSIVGDMIEFEKRGRAMGIIMTAFSVASIAGIPAGLWLASKYNWHAPFWAVGCLGILNIISIIIWVPPITQHLKYHHETKKKPITVLTDIWKDNNQLRALAFTTMIMLGHFSIIPYISPYMVANAGFSMDNIFLIYLVGGLLTIITAPIVGRTSDKLGKLPVFIFFALLSPIPIWLITNMWQVPLWGILTATALFFIIINGRTIPVQAMISNVVPPQQRGGFMSINSSVQLLAQSLASNIGGWMLTKTPEGKFLHYDWVGYFAIILILSSIFLARKIKMVN